MAKRYQQPPTGTEPSAPPASVQTPQEQPKTPDAPTPPQDVVETPKPPVTEKKEVTDTAPSEPPLVAEMETQLNELIAKLQTGLDSLRGQKDVTPDSCNLIKLSAAKVLREGTAVLKEVRIGVDKMRGFAREIEQRQKGLDEAIEKNRFRSTAFRTERAAFQKLKSLPDGLYYALVKEIEEREAKKAA